VSYGLVGDGACNYQAVMKYCCSEVGRPRKKTRIEWRHCFSLFSHRTHVARNTRHTSCPSGRRQASPPSWIRSR